MGLDDWRGLPWAMMSTGAAGTAALATSMASFICGAWFQRQHNLESIKDPETEMHGSAERESRAMYLCDLEARLQRSQQDLAAQQKSEQALRCSLGEQLRRATEELRSCREQLSELQTSLDSAAVPIICVNRSGLITYWNRKAGDVCRSTLEEAKSNRLTQYFGSVDETAFSPASIVSSMSSCRDGPLLTHCQRHVCVRSRSSGDSWQGVLLHISPRRSSSSSAVQGLLCIVQDVTKTKTELKQLELTVKDLYRANASIIGLDSKGNINEWNKTTEALTGYSAAEAMDKNFVKNFIAEEWADGVRWMVSEGLRGEPITNFEFSFFRKCGQRLDMLMSTSTRRDENGEVVGIIGVGKDITELRSESKMLANYVRICGAAVWSLRGSAHSGSVTECKTKEIEHLISQQAQMDPCDPRMVLWRASFVSILKTMCQNFWVKRKTLDEERNKGSIGDKAGGSPSMARSPSMAKTMEILGSSLGSSAAAVSLNLTNPAIIEDEFGYEFCFEAPDGSVKWYKVEGHLIEESLIEGKFEVTGSMQEVTSMWIDKVMGDRWQKWWSRMCHMVFDATLHVDTQEYRVLNGWGEEKVFGCKLQSHHPLLQLIKPEDTVSLKEAFNEVTFKGFERGRMLHLLRPGESEEMPAQCFLLSADQENPNECMMGIRMQANEKDGDKMLWDVARPNQVLTLDDLARLKSGLKRHSKVSRPGMRAGPRQHRPRSGAAQSSRSLCSIPEDLDGESDCERDQSDSGQSVSGSVKSDTESARSSSKSSMGSEDEDVSEEEAISRIGFCCSPPRSLSDAEVQRMSARGKGAWSCTAKSPKYRPQLAPAEKLRRKKPPREGPPIVKLRTAKGVFELNLDNFHTVGALRLHVEGITAIPVDRQTLILAGRRLPTDEDTLQDWQQLKNDVRPGQTLMLIGSLGKPPPGTTAEPPSSSACPTRTDEPSSASPGPVEEARTSSSTSHATVEESGSAKEGDGDVCEDPAQNAEAVRAEVIEFSAEGQQPDEEAGHDAEESTEARDQILESQSCSGVSETQQKTHK